MAQPPTDTNNDLPQQIEENLCITAEEWWGTIPGSVQATDVCLLAQRVQANPVVQCGPPRKVKKHKAKEVAQNLYKQTLKFKTLTVSRRYFLLETTYHLKHFLMVTGKTKQHLCRETHSQI